MIESYNLEYRGVFLEVKGEYHEFEWRGCGYAITKEFQLTQVIVGDVNIINILSQVVIDELELLALKKREWDEI